VVPKLVRSFAPALALVIANPSRLGEVAARGSPDRVAARSGLDTPREARGRDGAICCGTDSVFTAAARSVADSKRY
jgi:hypothetical protein